jgi:adenosylhomocysteine nucleosidase
LQAEARTVAAAAHHLGFRIAVGGGTAVGAEAAARSLVAEGALALVSIGLAGGLQPLLRAGKILIPREIVLENGQRYPTDEELSRFLGGPTPHAILGGDRIISDRREKKVLWTLTGGAAVDLESGAVARIATEYGLPFAALRVICDAATRDLPPVALEALDKRGKIELGSVLRALAVNPLQTPNLIGVATDALKARQALVRYLWSLKPTP